MCCFKDDRFVNVGRSIVGNSITEFLWVRLFLLNWSEVKYLIGQSFGNFLQKKKTLKILLLKNNNIYLFLQVKKGLPTFRWRNNYKNISHFIYGKISIQTFQCCLISRKIIFGIWMAPTFSKVYPSRVHLVFKWNLL